MRDPIRRHPWAHVAAIAWFTTWALVVIAIAWKAQHP